MSIKVAISAVVAGLLVCSDGNAADAAKIVGAGGQTCGQFAQDYGKDVKSEELYFHWAQGYISALNVVVAILKQPQKDLYAVPVDDQMRFIRNYCAANSLVPYSAAASKLYDSFQTVADRSDAKR